MEFITCIIELIGKKSLYILSNVRSQIVFKFVDGSFEMKREDLYRKLFFISFFPQLFPFVIFCDFLYFKAMGQPIMKINKPN